VPDVQSLTQYSPPPSVYKPATAQWTKLPQANRQQLLWLLSHLLERQLDPSLLPNKEDDDEPDNSIE
jgi:hypothetical protein